MLDSWNEKSEFTLPEGIDPAKVKDVNVKESFECSNKMKHDSIE